MPKEDPKYAYASEEDSSESEEEEDSVSRARRMLEARQSHDEMMKRIRLRYCRQSSADSVFRQVHCRRHREEHSALRTAFA